ncbi:MAG: IS21-like element helper ATPase IstB [Polyangiaceae bacterium]|nr:IS21-like element helper ATPase IstB [Polyangiaceae bacterium]
MGLLDDLLPLLKKLRLSGLLETLDLRQRQAVEDNMSHVEFLVRLLQDEVDRRDTKQIDQRVRRASFEKICTLEDFDFQFNPEIPKAQVLDIATCQFVPRAENVLLIGESGLGKSHLAQAFALRACRTGYTAQHILAEELFRQLRAGRGDGTYERRLARFAKVDVLVVDDLGLRPLAGQEPLDLYEVIRQRYEKRPLVITTNRDVEELTRLLPDPLLASAAMDRLLHHSHVLRLVGDTYRNPKKPNQKKSTKKESPK